MQDKAGAAQENIEGAARNPARPLVSIIVPTYNYGAYIGEALDSCLEQTYPNIEVIVVDDGSTDNTAQVVRAYLDRHPSRIKYIAQPNTGVAVARNKGMEHATGAYIAYLDSDDYLTPDAIETRWRVFSEHPDVGIVLTEKYNLRDGKRSYKPRHTRDIVSSTLYQNLLLGEMSSAINTALFRADVARRYSFPEVRTGQDTPYLTKLLFHTKAYVLAQPTLVMRYHADSLRNYAAGTAHPRLALISLIFDDPEYSGALEPLRATFATNIYLFVFKRLYKAGHYEHAGQYYLKALSADPVRNAFRLKPLLRYIRGSCVLLMRKLTGKRSAPPTNN